MEKKAFLPDYLHESSTPWYLLGIFLLAGGLSALGSFAWQADGNQKPRERQSSKIQGTKGRSPLSFVFDSPFSYGRKSGCRGENTGFFLPLDRVFGFAPIFFIWEYFFLSLPSLPPFGRKKTMALPCLRRISFCPSVLFSGRERIYSDFLWHLVSSCQ